MTCSSGWYRGYGIKQDFIPLFFFMYVHILWQGQKAFLTIVEFDYLLFQISISIDIFHLQWICDENGLLCCDLSCKWVTCKSGCKRFGKQALQIQNGALVTIALFWLTLYKVGFQLFSEMSHIGLYSQANPPA